MPFRWFLCLALSWCSVQATAATVAFLELRNYDGSLLQLEPGGRFAHVAVRVGKHWLHAYPRGGVALVDDILPYGQSVTLLEDPTIPDPSLARAAAWIGKPFDGTFTWGREDATYCARLVADLLAVPPKPMDFNQEGWRGIPDLAVGRLGISPDDLYAALLAHGYRHVSAYRPAVAATASACGPLLEE